MRKLQQLLSLPQIKTALVISALILGTLFLNKTYSDETKIRINNHIFSVELAISTTERSRGLMHRGSLAANTGMLFIYSEPQTVSFWMKETLIPLDLLFFDKDGQLIELHHNIQPCKVSACKTYTNKKPAQFALEFAAGTAKKMGIKEGSNFTIVITE